MNCVYISPTESPRVADFKMRLAERDNLPVTRNVGKGPGNKTRRGNRRRKK